MLQYLITSIRSIIPGFIIALGVSHIACADDYTGANFSIWPDTGQNNCFDNIHMINPCGDSSWEFYGQDAYYQGPQHAYSLLGNGTIVQDHVTGLMWELKNSYDTMQDFSNPHDADNQYSWCNPEGPDANGYPGVCSGNNTKTFIEAINAEQFGGFSDWRMPTIKELASLINRGMDGPALDPLFHLAETWYPTYWSATPMAADSSSAWYLGSALGWQYPVTHAAVLGAVAVRGGTPPPKHNRYIDLGDGTVLDNVTCLQWQKENMNHDNDGSNYYTWQHALAAAQSLELAGYDDWRLPNVNELLSLVDYTRTNPSIDPVFGPDAGTPYHHTSTPHMYSNLSWAIDFLDGRVNDFAKTNVFIARAVRDGDCLGVPEAGDYNFDSTIDIEDVILSLQVAGGQVSTIQLHLNADSNDDDKIGIEDAIHALQTIAQQ